MTRNPPTAKAPAAQAVAAAIAGAVETRMLAPGEITPSPTNPRKTFPEEQLLELADSLKREGQVQAIIVRPISVDAHMAFNKAHPGFEGDHPRYEIVVGERRWRAATMAGLPLRAEIRELDDLQVIRIQIIENLHRQDVHALEEAEGYEFLLHKSGQQVSIDQLADEIGKSRSYIHKRMRLTALCDAARKAFYAGKFDPSVALLIARQATPELQLRAIADIEQLGVDASYRRIRQMVADRYQLLLADAPFDVTDAKLVKGCGTCGACPKRTGNQGVIFDDVDSADTCIDPDCFSAKRDAHHTALLARAKKEGHEVLTGDEAEKAFPYGIFPNGCTPGYRGVKAVAFREGETEVTYAQLIEREGKRAPKGVVVLHPDYQHLGPTTLLTNEAAGKLLAKFAPKPAPELPAKKETAADREQREEREAQYRNGRIAHKQRQLLIDALLQKADQPRELADLILIIFALIGEDVSDELLAELGISEEAAAAEDFDHESAMLNAMRNMNAVKLGSIAFRMALGDDLMQYTNREPPTPALQFAASRHGIDNDAIRREAEATADSTADKDSDEGSDAE